MSQTNSFPTFDASAQKIIPLKEILEKKQVPTGRDGTGI